MQTTQTSSEIQVPGEPAPRRISRITQVGKPAPGFAGPGHTAVEVFGPHQLGRTDPFVMLMEDRLDFHPGQPVGGEHPHAGLETVTLMLEGSLIDPAFGRLETGDIEWTTAGRGIIHSENLEATGWARILQLWIALPGDLRMVPPALQIVPLRTLPIRREPGVEARLYSGRTGDLVSPTLNRVPVTLVDFRLEAGAGVNQALPGGYSGFLYMVAGSLNVGETTLRAGDVGWLEPADTSPDLLLQANGEGAHVVLYAGAPIGESLVQRGPFVAGSPAELANYYRAFGAGTFQRLSGLDKCA